jgi:DNA repair protein SbcD/Mre11
MWEVGLMPIRILHTGDNHIGQQYQGYPPVTTAALVQERVDALQRAVDIGNSEEAHLLVVAGDLFDGDDVATGQLEHVARALLSFEKQIVVLPGNHDHCGADSTIWERFKRLPEFGERILILDTCFPVPLNFGDTQVTLFPCPCDQRQSQENQIGWVREAAADCEDIKIGIAHGNVDGLGLDADGNYFNMSLDELGAAGVDVWLLGHIHKHFPDMDGIGRHNVFMAGSTAPENVRRNHPGGCWIVDVSGDGVGQFRRFETGSIAFNRVEWSFPDKGSVLELQQHLAQFPEKTVLDLRFSGELSQADQASLAEWLNVANDKYFNLSHAGMNDLTVPFSLDEVRARYEAEFFPGKLLGELEDEGAVRVLDELIREIGGQGNG